MLLWYKVCFDLKIHEKRHIFLLQKVECKKKYVLKCNKVEQKSLVSRDHFFILKLTNKNTNKKSCLGKRRKRKMLYLYLFLQISSAHW